ncbi:MAG: hypothetical protein FWC70_05390 [Defluviitaleaceae bacterium]|nr:hypothetical protein [Defluviitaleaceae bacterium]
MTTHSLEAGASFVIKKRAERVKNAIKKTRDGMCPLLFFVAHENCSGFAPHSLALMRRPSDPSQEKSP